MSATAALQALCGNLLTQLEAAVRSASKPAPTRAQHDQISRVLAQLEASVVGNADTEGPCSPAMAQALVTDCQVPLRLGKVTAALWSSGNSLNGSAVLAVYTLVVLLRRLKPPSAKQQQAAAEAAMPMRVAVAKQLTQSGLIQLLPQMLQQVAGELDALRPQWNTAEQHTSSGGGSSGGGGGSNGTHWRPEGRAFNAAFSLLLCCTALMRLWPGGVWRSAAASAVLAQMPRLVVATLRAAGARMCAAATAAGDAAGSTSRQLLRVAADALLRAAVTAAQQEWLVVLNSLEEQRLALPAGAPLPSMQAMQAAPDALAAAVLVVAVAGHAEAVGQQQQHQQQQQQSAGLLSPCVQQLLQPALGISAEAVAALGKVSLKELSFARIQDVLDAAELWHQRVSEAASSQQTEQQQGEEPTAEQAALKAQQHLLMAALELQYARRHSECFLSEPADAASEAAALQVCSFSACSCVEALSACCTAHAEHQQRHERRPLVLLTGHVHLVGRQRLLVAISHLPPALLAELLPVALQLLRDVLRQLRRATAAADSSSSSGEADPEQLALVFVHAAAVTGLLQAAGHLTSFSGSSAAALWQQHAAALMAQLQELLRLLGQLPADAVPGVKETRTVVLDGAQQLCLIACVDHPVSSADDVYRPAPYTDEATTTAGPLVEAALAASGGAEQQQSEAQRLQQQLFGLMCSALKLHRHSAAWRNNPAGVWLGSLWIVLLCANDIAGQPSMQQQVAAAAAAAAGAGATAATTPPLWPWLVLAGRCCLHLAAELQPPLLPGAAGRQQQHEQGKPNSPAAAASAVASVDRLCEYATDAASKLTSCFDKQTKPAAGGASAAGAAAAAAPRLVLQAAAAGLFLSEAAVQALLQQLADAAGAASSLAARGAELCEQQQQLSASAVLQQLGVTHEATVEAVEAAVEAALAGSGRALSTSEAVHAVLVHSPQVAGLMSALQALGSTLCALPIPHACNNPACTTLARRSEQALVDAPGTMCGGCRTARYCGRACQATHRGDHRRVCRAMGQLALSGGGGGVA